MQRLINIKIAKLFRTVSYEALCILTGHMPIIINLQEAAELYTIKKNGQHGNHMIDTALSYSKWSHPKDIINIKPKSENTNHTYTVFTDGSKSEVGVGSGIVIFKNKHIERHLKYRLDTKCTNNQAEQLAKHLKL